MTFFYDLNKKLSDLAARQTLNEGKGDGNLANNAKPYDKVTRGDVIAGRLGKDEKGGKANEVDEGKDEGKPGKMFAKISADAAKRYGSKEAGDRVAGKIRADKAKAGTLEEDQVEEGVMDVAKKVGGVVKKVAGKALDTLGHGSDEDLRKDLQKKMGLPQTGKKPGQTNESIKLIAVKEGADKTVRVYRDTAYNEFHVRVFHKGQEVVESRYFTESQEDAITTADYMVEGAFTMTPKQKSFAKLAPPTDKITFADKIAGAKKEVDEMLGDVAAEAMKSAVGKMRMTGEARDDDDDVYAYQDPSKTKTHKTASGGTVTRHGGVTRHQAAPGHYGGYDPETDPDKDDDKPGAGEKRGKGRPKGTGKRIGAKGPSGKSKLMTREGPDDLADQGEYDQEGDMALDDINTIESAANELQSIIDANENLPEWVQSKINKAMDYLDTARDYMSAQEDDEQMIGEKAVSKKQQKFMGMVHAAQKGEKPASKAVAKVAKSMGKKDAEDFAATKHKGLPNKVKEESTDKEDQKAERAGKKVAKDIEHDEGHKGKDDNRAEKAGKKVTKDIEYDDKKDRKEKKKDEVEENTVAGSVAPAMGGAAPKGKGGMTFGKGVYEGAIAESFDSKLNNILNEGMSVNMSADQDGKKSLTVTATDDDAVKLSQLLNLAGIGGQSQGYGEVCPGCGSSDCGCDQMHEELANSAENTEYADTDYMVNGLSGGLNGRKTDQSTLPVPNRDPRRTVGSVAESNDVVELYKRIA